MIKRIVCFSLILVLFLGQVCDSAFAQEAASDPSNNDSADVTAIAFSPDGKTLASGVKDGRVLLWDVENGEQKRSFTGQRGLSVTEVTFNSQGDKVTSVGNDSVVRVWDVKADKLAQSLTAHEQPIRTVAYSPDEKILASAGEDTKIALWNTQTGKLLKFLEGQGGTINEIAFSKDGKTLASAGEEGRIILWDIKTSKKRRVLLGHAKGVTSVAFSPDDRLLGSASKDGSVRLWQVASGRQRQILSQSSENVVKVAFSPDGKTLAGTTQSNQVVLWDVKVGRPSRNFRVNRNRNFRISRKAVASQTGVAFSPNGNTLASVDEEGQIILWDVAKGEPQKSLRALPQPTQKRSVQSLRATPGRVLTALPPPPGGPILIITSASNPFSNYYAEILRTEGLNYFNTSDISSITAATLTSYDLVILSEMPLTADQVTIFSDWVSGGGNLITMHPDKQLAGLLGLTDTGNQPLNGGYLLVDTSKRPGNGIVNQTIQFHSVGDRYNLNGATSLATLYTDATTATSNPAVTLRQVGNKGGQAAAFTYDLANSVILTRQGNPAWREQERDEQPPIRSDDLFFGKNPNDSQPDWVDLNKVAIPQADEQQRLLANLILTMNLNKKPLPRFWYFPNGKKAVVLMSGDDHANGGTGPRFNQFQNQSPANCSVDNWECIRGTSYIYPNTSLSNAKALNDAGFEIALHVNTGCADYKATTPEESSFAKLDSFYTSQLNEFKNNFSNLPAPVTQRHHCLVWSDWSSTPEVELSKGIRLDTTYYYWPQAWINDRPGFFTGSGMPMRLTKLDGTIIDVYKSATQMTDESGQSYPLTVDTLLDRAVGAEGYYGIFNVNAHTDAPTSVVADAVIESAKQRKVPVVSARQVLTWLDGRNSSSFGTLSWSNNNLKFSIAKATGTTGLQAMLPTRSVKGILGKITRSGSTVNYTKEAIKGVEYAFFPADAGSYVANYTPDTTAPKVTVVTPTNNATDVKVGTTVTVTFSEGMNASTINTNTLELHRANTLIPATVTYDAATNTAKLKPNTSLAGNTAYTLTIKGGANDPRVKDLAGNALAANFTSSFTTGAIACSQQPCNIWNASTTPTNPSVSDPNAVELGVKFRSDLDGFITGIRFYKGNGNTGLHIGNLWSRDGQSLAKANFTNETTSGWQQVNFSNPVAITANTVYVASYHTETGNYAADNNFFANSGVDKEPLRILRNGVDGGNGVYKYGASGFPDNTYESSNYWVDVVFTTTNPTGGV
jgi:WD40 repeat protein